MPKTPSFFRRSKKKTGLGFIPRTVVLKNKKPLNITVRGGVQSDSFCIIELSDGKQPYRSGKLKNDDVIISVNDERVLGETHQYVVDRIMESKGDIKLTVAATTDPNMRKVSHVYNMKHPDPIVAEIQTSLKRKIYDLSPPFTTRPPTEGELHGVDYHFVSKEEFESLIASHRMLDYGTRDGYLYGNIIPTDKMISRRRDRNRDSITATPTRRKSNLSTLSKASSTPTSSPSKLSLSATAAARPSLKVSDADAPRQRSAKPSALSRDSSRLSTQSPTPSLSHPRSPVIHHTRRFSTGPQIQTLVLARAENGRFGFSFDAGVQYEYLLSVRSVENYICILSTTNRDLRVGDCILAVNGMSVAACASEDVEEIIQGCGDPMEITTTCVDDALLDEGKRISTNSFLLSSKFDSDELALARRELRKVVYESSVPYTTRKPRPGETGNYNFVTDEEFEKLKKQGKFLEVGERNGVKYATPVPEKTAHLPTSRSSTSLRVQNAFTFKDSTFTIERASTKESWGMELLKGPKYIFVHRVVEDSPAHRAFIRKGMQLLELNGKNMRKALIADATEALANAGTTIELRMRYNMEGLTNARTVAKSIESSPYKHRLQAEEEVERKLTLRLHKSNPRLFPESIDGDVSGVYDNVDESEVQDDGDDGAADDGDGVDADGEGAGEESAADGATTERRKSKRKDGDQSSGNGDEVNRVILVAGSVAVLVAILSMVLFYLHTTGVIQLPH